jgi:3-oxoacyl-[acyl-carrier-protein] synthase-3
MLYVHGIGHFHPSSVITNNFLESLDIGIDQQWILQRVGIKERRTVLSLDYIQHTRNKDIRAAFEASEYSNAETAKRAAEVALKCANLQPSDIGMVIAGGCSPETLTPAESCSIAAALGIQCPCIDLNSACSSFSAQMNFLNMLRPDKLPDYILVVNAENTTRRINYNDRSTCVLWGDGTSAVIVSTRNTSRTKMIFTTQDSDASGWNKVTIKASGHFIQDGSAVQYYAIRQTISTLNTLLEQRPANNDEPLWFIGHQANLVMLNSVCRQAQISENMHFYNVDRFGNCGAAGAPSVLSQNWATLPDGWLAMAMVGAGLSWGGILIHSSSKDQL